MIAFNVINKDVRKRRLFRVIAKMLVNEQKTTTISDFVRRYDEIMSKISEKFKI